MFGRHFLIADLEELSHRSESLCQQPEFHSSGNFPIEERDIMPYKDVAQC